MALGKPNWPQLYILYKDILKPELGLVVCLVCVRTGRTYFCWWIPALHDCHPVAHQQGHQGADDNDDAVVDGAAGGSSVVLHISRAL